MNNRITIALFVAVAAMAVAGCVSTSEPVPTGHYTLTVASPANGGESNNTPASSSGSKILRVSEVTAPAWLDSTSMYYRLGYRQNAQVSAYSRSDWVAPPPQLLGAVLQQTLSGMPQWKAVLGTDAVAHADLTLRTDLNDFEQTFSSKDQSVGVLDATATLADGQVIAQKRFHLEVPAPSADAEGGVRALNKASNEFASRLKQWLASVTSQSQPAG